MKLLFLAHRAPWPPDKGDRLRSHGILRWLARRHEIFLGAFTDGGGPSAREVEDHLRPLCAEVEVMPRPPTARGALALLTGRPISFEIFSSRRLDAFAARTMRRVEPDAVLGYSGQMAVPLLRLSGVPRVLDLVDVDSEKWRSRYERSRNPLHLVEARRVRKYEDRCVAELDAVTLTSRREANILGNEDQGVHVVKTGVDLDYFTSRRENPSGARIGFIGAMDYPPNAEGALWFARDVLPIIHETHPDATFIVVGRNAPAALAQLPGVETTGWVDDIRPVLQGMTTLVAPINDAHGVQTKALVGMALGVPTVMTSGAAGGIEAQHDVNVLVADDAREFAGAVTRLLDNAPERKRLAEAGRRFVEDQCDWERNLRVLERLLGT